MNKSDVHIIQNIDKFELCDKRNLLFCITAFNSDCDVLQKKYGKRSAIASFSKINNEFFYHLDNAKKNLDISLATIKKIEGNSTGNPKRYLDKVDDINSSVNVFKENDIDADLCFDEQISKDESILESFYRLNTNHDDYVKYDIMCAKYIDKPETFVKDILTKIFNINPNILNNELEDMMVIFMNFSIITPLQSFVINLLEFCKIKVIYYVIGDTRKGFNEKEVNKIIYKTYEGHNIIVDEIYDESNKMLSHIYSDINEGKKEDLEPNEIEKLSKMIDCYQYNTEVSYYEDIIKIIAPKKDGSKEKNVIISANHKESIRGMLRYDPSKFSKTITLKNYTIGRIILELYNSFDKSKKEVVFTDRSIRIFFSSNVFMPCNEYNATIMLDTYNKIKMFLDLEEPQLSSEIELKIDNLLKNRKVEVINKYTKAIAGYKIPEYRIIAFKKVLKKITLLIKAIFIQNNASTIMEHFTVLEKILKTERYFNYEEKQAYESLQSVCEEISKITRGLALDKELVEYKLSYESLSIAIKSLLKTLENKMIDDENIIKKLNDASFLTLYECDKVIVIDVNSNTMAASRSAYTWPISTDTMKKYLDKVTKIKGKDRELNDFDKKRLLIHEDKLRCSLNIVENKEYANINSMYLILNSNKKTEFWRVGNLDKSLDNSYYLERLLLNKLKKEYIPKGFNITDSSEKVKLNKIDTKSLKKICSEDNKLVEYISRTFDIEKDIAERYFNSIPCPLRKSISTSVLEVVHDRYLAKTAFAELVYESTKEKVRNDVIRSLELALFGTNNEAFVKEQTALVNYKINKSVERRHILGLGYEEIQKEALNEFLARVNKIAVNRLHLEEKSFTKDDINTEMRKICLNDGHILAISDKRVCISCTFRLMCPYAVYK